MATSIMSSKFSSKGSSRKSAKESSPLTGIIAEESVVIDFGEHEGKSVLEVNDTHPVYYSYLVEQREKGNFAIKRTKDKIFRLYCHGENRYH